MTLVCNARKKGHDFAQSVKSMVIILKQCQKDRLHPINN
jgi:hypothetical protein